MPIKNGLDTEFTAKLIFESFMKNLELKKKLKILFEKMEGDENADKND